jgi:hypothetical protein
MLGYGKASYRKLCANVGFGAGEGREGVEWRLGWSVGVPVHDGLTEVVCGVPYGS